MSRTWWLTTNTNHSLEEFSKWLTDWGKWSDISISAEYHRLGARSSDSAISLICVDVLRHRPGTANNAIDKIAFPATLTITQELQRTLDHCGRLDKIYELAFRFAKFDPECNLYFELEDRGIFKRVNNRYVVNPDQFFAKSLAEFLTFDYILADSDKRNSLLVS